jgi:hypothetical protein
LALWELDQVRVNGVKVAVAKRMETMKSYQLGLVLSLGVLWLAPTAGAVGFVAVTWGDDAVHFLDQNMADTGSFSTSVGLPSGVATLGNLIWVGSFTTPSVMAYNFSGAEQFHWALPTGFQLQALDYAGNGQLLGMDASASQLVRFDAFTGAVLGSIPAISDSTEAVAISGQGVWQLTDTSIYLTSLADGSVIRAIPNAAYAEAFEGTAMAIDGNTLVLGADSGNWYRVSMTDGSILSSGNNGLSMYDLQPVIEVPESHSACWALALLSLAWEVRRSRGAQSRSGANLVG